MKSPIEAAERPGHDVGQPEREDSVELECVVGAGDQRDDATEDGDRRTAADRELLREQVPGRGSEREREQDRQPVEALGRVVTMVWIDGVRSNARLPDRGAHDS
jgi:hypothetical protein